ncbi:acyl-CoA dehydrogenase [Catenulispora sp. NF23]|uniref:acyl-CoA dehydrogenase n=1 Tax=Catenulispora pinistramenti TaxID=2705254 RepID=UPI001BA696F7|nr:acyl-CoA dehydrogenase [Catenulispora pinistramenti]MBS2536304.1 acyl-CoA dehydrogenase [Catenulispora pinistramenti]
MSHYKSSVRDLEFNLFEVLRVQDKLNAPPFQDVDEETARRLLGELEGLATGVLSDSLVDADRNPPAFDPERHDVTMPASVVKAVGALVQGGWDRTSIRGELGGFGIPAALSWSCTELILGANPALYFYVGGKISAQIIFDNGTPEQQQWARFAIARDWGSTMVLTEPDVGSDVGQISTKAVRQEDGSWHLEGVKRFITAAAQGELTENIMHLVLARPEGPGVEARRGTKGLGLFLVPMHHFDPSAGELTGERNGVYVTSVEDKMGLKASTTCELAFGQYGKAAKGWLLGERVDGITQMFDAITYARMMVGIKSISTLSSAYLNALEFARDRVQGADLTQLLEKNAPRVPIMRHPDVRRTLMTLKAYAEGMRGLYLYTASLQDGTAGFGGDSAAAAKVHDLLLPVIKGFGAERSWHLLSDALQVFGGSGYMRDYPIEQYIRDGKVDTLYEGTTAIQSMDFFFRKVARDGGIAFNHLTGEIAASIEADHDDRLDFERDQLSRALQDVQRMSQVLFGYLGEALEDPKSVYRVGRHTVRFLLAVGDLAVGWRLFCQAKVASRAIDEGADGAGLAFYQGKVTAARFFARTVLPELSTQAQVIEADDDGLMDLDEAAF